MTLCPTECTSQPHPFPWFGIIGWIVFGVAGIYLLWWLKWLWKFRKPSWWDCPSDEIPLVDAKHYYGPVWWKEVFSLSMDDCWLHWLDELHQRYPCASYGVDKMSDNYVKGLVQVMERHCPLCDQEFAVEHYRRLFEKYGPEIPPGLLR